MHHTFWCISVLSLHNYDFDISKFHVLWKMQTHFENLLFRMLRIQLLSLPSRMFIEKQHLKRTIRNLLTFDTVMKFQNKKFPSEHSRNASA